MNECKKNIEKFIRLNGIWYSLFGCLVVVKTLKHGQENWPFFPISLFCFVVVVLMTFTTTTTKRMIKNDEKKNLFLLWLLLLLKSETRRERGREKKDLRKVSNHRKFDFKKSPTTTTTKKKWTKIFSLNKQKQTETVLMQKKKKTKKIWSAFDFCFEIIKKKSFPFCFWSANLIFTGEKKNHRKDSFVKTKPKKKNFAKWN